jgi:hypothetical protein
MFKYYIIKTEGDKKEVYGVTKETKRSISAIIIKSTIKRSNKGKTIKIPKNSISKNIPQFDFTLTFDQ